MRKSRGMAHCGSYISMNLQIESGRRPTVGARCCTQASAQHADWLADFMPNAQAQLIRHSFSPRQHSAGCQSARQDGVVD